jgi:DNA (cytosine-5)-methyltransferase 1
VPSLTVGSLFSGIGGIDLGLERAGHRVLWHSEIDNYASRVLKKHWPEIPNLGDVKKINWSEVPNVDIIAGGYPCQPFSQAGKRKGKEDPRHLWPYVLDAIRTIRPRYALMENVRGHLTLGFGDVLADLAGCGYSAEWQIISAASVGAPHRRDRLFFVAYPEVFGGDGRGNKSDSETSSERSALQSEIRRSGGIVAYPDGDRSRRFGPLADDREEVFGGEDYSRGEDGMSGRAARHWETEPGMGRVAHGIPARVDRLRGLGNAVVPYVAELVGRLISYHSEKTRSPSNV